MRHKVTTKAVHCHRRSSRGYSWYNVSPQRSYLEAPLIIHDMPPLNLLSCSLAPRLWWRTLGLVWGHDMEVMFKLGTGPELKVGTGTWHGEAWSEPELGLGMLFYICHPAMHCKFDILESWQGHQGVAKAGQHNIYKAGLCWRKKVISSYCLDLSLKSCLNTCLFSQA